MCKCPRVSVVREVDAFGEARKRRQRVVVTVTSEDVLWDVDALSAEGIVGSVTVGRGVLTIFMLGAPDGDDAASDGVLRVPDECRSWLFCG